MGQSTNAILAYGYDLGGDEEGWKIREAGEYGELPDELPEGLAWYNPDSDDDFTTQAEERLLAQIGGFTEKWAPGGRESGYFDRKKAAEEQVGVEFESYCSGEFPMYVLAAHVITVYRGHSQLIDPAALANDPATQGWDEKLTAAITALGMTPKQEKPGWVLVSYWG